MGLIAHYKLDGNANDALGKYNGTASNVTWVDGKLGQAGSFTTSYMSLSNHPVRETGEFSLAFWVAPRSTATACFFCARKVLGNGLSVFYSNGTIRFDFGNQWTTSVSLDTNQWNHIVLTRSGNTKFIYKNGVFQGSTTFEDLTDFNPTLATIGCSQVNGSNYANYFDGLIDDYRIYDHALSEREVRDLSQGLVLHYTFDQFQEPTENLYASASKSFAESLIFPITPPAPPENGGTWSGLAWNGDITIPSVSAGESVTWSGYYMPYSSNTALTPVNSDRMGVHAWSSRGNEGVVLSCPEWNKWYKFTFTKTFDSSATSVRIEDRGYDYSNTDAAPYTIGYWCNVQIEKKKYATPFVNGARVGIVRDQSTQGNDAPLALANTPKWVEGGMVGKGCYEFVGDGKTPGILSPQIKTDKYTISFWAKHTSINKMVFGSGRNTTFYWYGDNSWKYMHGGTSGEFYYPRSQTINIGEWGHFVVTYDGSNIRIYRNGVYEGIKASSGIPNFDRHSIGWGHSNQSYDFQGQMDDVRIYTTALSADEVKELYQQRASLDAQGNFYSSLISSNVGYQKVWGDGTGVGFTTYGIDESSVSTNGVLRFTTTNTDPMINMYNIGSFDPNVYKFIQVKYRVVSGNAGNVEIFYCNTQYTGATSGISRSASLNSDGNWNVVTVAMYTHANWTDSNITGWRFDMGNVSGVTTEVEWIRLVSDTGALSVKSNKVVGDFSEVGITNGLVAYYPLNKDAKDYSGNGYDGVVNGAVPVGGGFDGKGAYSFDGTGTRDGTVSGAYIAIPEPITDTRNYENGITYSFWLYIDSDSVNRQSLFFGAAAIRHIEIYSSGKYFRTEGGAVNEYSFGSSTFPNTVRGAWSYFTIVFDTGSTDKPVRWYQDGTLFSTNLLGTDYFSFNKIGRATGTTRYTYAKSLDGDLCNVKIFNRALTPEEIAVEYKRTGVFKMTQHNGTVYIQGQIKETI